MTRSLLFLVGFLLAACGSQPDRAATDFDPAPWIEQGHGVAAATFSMMTARLERALAEEGVEGAMRYCNVAAHPLTDSLSPALNATIRRTSLRVRNPKDAPDDREREILVSYKEAFDRGEMPEPIAVEMPDGSVTFHAPIITQALCTNCHGVVGQMLTESNYKVIKEMYPDDEAVGYGVDQLRGMWSISFDRD